MNNGPSQAPKGAQKTNVDLAADDLTSGAGSTRRDFIRSGAALFFIGALNPLAAAAETSSKKSLNGMPEWSNLEVPFKNLPAGEVVNLADKAKPLSLKTAVEKAEKAENPNSFEVRDVKIYSGRSNVYVAPQDQNFIGGRVDADNPYNPIHNLDVTNTGFYLQNGGNVTAGATFPVIVPELPDNVELVPDFVEFAFALLPNSPVSSIQGLRFRFLRNKTMAEAVDNSVFGHPIDFEEIQIPLADLDLVQHLGNFETENGSMPVVFIRESQIPEALTKNGISLDFNSGDTIRISGGLVTNGAEYNILTSKSPIFPGINPGDPNLTEYFLRGNDPGGSGVIIDSTIPEITGNENNYLAANITYRMQREIRTAMIDMTCAINGEGHLYYRINSGTGQWHRCEVPVSGDGTPTLHHMDLPEVLHYRREETYAKIQAFYRSVRGISITPNDGDIPGGNQ